MLDTEIIDSAKKYVQGRLTSPFYGVLLFSELLTHLKFIITLFFVSEDKIWETNHLLKSDYLWQTYVNYNSWAFYVWLVVPLIITFLVIWKFPNWFVLRAYKKELEDNTEKKLFELTEERKLQQESIKNLNVESEKTQKQKTVRQREKELEKIDPTTKWEDEYNQFKQTKIFYNFRYIIESVYRRNGDKSWYSPGVMNPFVLPQDIVVYSDTNGLIRLTNNLSKIELTEKGKFFVKKYSSEN